MKKKSMISRITVGRLFNLGNYEHVRYEITTDIPAGVNVRSSLVSVMKILGGLRPVKLPYNYEHMLATLATPPSELTETERDNLDNYRKQVQAVAGARALRDQALKGLDEVGGTSKHVDAKDKWDDVIPF